MTEPTLSNSLSGLLSERIKRIPKNPGIYMMMDKTESIIYIGKAKNLKKRVSSYFQKQTHDLKPKILVEHVISVDTIITATEQEALILESTLIRKHKPKYNVILKDDKRYPLLKVDMRNEYPAVTIVRKRKKDGSLYFGPFAPASSVRATLKLINKPFKPTNRNTPTRQNRNSPCLN